MFEFIQTPQPTVLKGKPLAPTPAMAFKGFNSGYPIQNPKASLVAFSVVCFLADTDRLAKGELVLEVCAREVKSPIICALFSGRISFH